jgi:transposase
MNETLSKLRRRNSRQTIFASKEACRTCDNRCTISQNAKEVSFVDGAKYVPVRMYGSKKPVNLLPEDAVIHHNSRALLRKWADTKVLIRVSCDDAKIHERMCTVEHPFGSIKWYGDAGYVLCRGKRKVSAEIGLSFLGYNIKRAISMVATEELLKKMGARQYRFFFSQIKRLCLSEKPLKIRRKPLKISGFRTLCGAVGVTAFFKNLGISMVRG